MSAGERYSFSLTTFSPSGKLVQIEYALNAVNAGQPTVGIKAKDGTVIATEKKHKSTLQDETTYFKVKHAVSSILLSNSFRLKRSRITWEWFMLAWDQIIEYS